MLVIRRNFVVLRLTMRNVPKPTKDTLQFRLLTAKIQVLEMFVRIAGIYNSAKVLRAHTENAIADKNSEKAL